VQAVAVAALAHRLSLGEGPDTAGAAAVVGEVLRTQPVPRP